MKNNKRGSILIPALMLFLMLCVLGLVMLRASTLGVNSSGNDHDSRQAYYSAKSLCDSVVDIIRSNDDTDADWVAMNDLLTGDLAVPGASVQSLASVGSLPADTGSATVKVECVSFDTAANGVITQVVKVSGTAAYKGYDSNVSRTVTITRTPNAGGTMAVLASGAGLGSNSVEIQGTVQGDLYFAGMNSFTAYNNATVNGNLYLNAQSGSGTIKLQNVTFGERHTRVVLQASQITLDNTTLGDINAVSKSITFSGIYGNTSYRVATGDINLSVSNTLTVSSTLTAGNFPGGVIPAKNANSADALQAVKMFEGKTVLDYPTVDAEDTEIDPDDGLITEDGKVELDAPWSCTQGIAVDTGGSVRTIQLVDSYGNAPTGVTTLNNTITVTGGGTLNILITGGLQLGTDFAVVRGAGAEDTAVNLVVASGDVHLQAGGNPTYATNFIVPNGEMQVQNGITVEGAVVCGRKFWLNPTATIDVMKNTARTNVSGAFDFGTDPVPSTGGGSADGYTITVELGKYTGNS